MRASRSIPILLALILIACSGLGYLWGSPRVVDMSPDPGAREVPAGTPLRITFSRPMHAESISEYLEIDPPLPGSFTWEGQTLVFTPDEPWPPGRLVSVQVDPGVRSAGWLSLALRGATSWSFTVGSPRLAYLYPSDGASNIYTLNPLTGESEQLTESTAGVLEFDVNADGTQIYYSVRNADGGSDIYRRDIPRGSANGQEPSADRSGPVQVMACGRDVCRTPRISSAGSWLAYERTAAFGSREPAYPRLWLVPIPADDPSDPAPVDASSALEPFLAGEADHQTYQPQWSPDGMLAFYDTQLSAYVILDPGSGERTLFPNQTGQPGTWDPTGQGFIAPEISYLTAGDPDVTGLNPIANSHLILFNRLDGSTRDLSQSENLEDAAPAFSLDGSTLAFARKFLDLASWTPGRQLWLANADGSNARQLTNDPYYNHFEFAWSPANDQLAFVRFNQTIMTEPPELWLINPDGRGARQVQSGGYAPQWIP